MHWIVEYEQQGVLGEGWAVYKKCWIKTEKEANKLVRGLRKLSKQEDSVYFQRIRNVNKYQEREETL